MNNYVNLRRSTALVFILASGAGLAAQEAGSLAGTVLNPSGAPVPDVRVTIASPNMLGVRTLTTNARGEFRAPLLPVGNYTISISKQGWLGQRAENVRVGLGASVTHNFRMRPVSETSASVEITTSSDEIDKTETAAKFNFSAGQLESLPVTNRRFQGAADFSPGLVSGSGGSFSIRGGATQNTQYRINGTDIKDDIQGTQTNLQVVADNIEDVQVVLSELNARYGRSLGGSINVVTKSGTNTFSGSIRADLSRETWTAQPAYNKWYSRYYEDDEMYSDSLSRSYQITLNGPIVKDHLWFAASTSLSPDSKSILSIPQTAYGSVNANSVVQALNGPTTGSTTDRNDPVNSRLIAGPDGYQWSRLDQAKTYLQTTSLDFYQVKLTGMVLQDHTVEVGYTREERKLDPRDPGLSIYRIAALGYQNSIGQQYSFSYRGILTSNLFLEARYNKMQTNIVWPQGDLSFMPGNESLIMWAGVVGNVGAEGSGIRGFGIGTSTVPTLRGNQSGGVNLKWITDLGSTNHEFDFGIDYYSGVLNEVAQTGAGNFQVNVAGVYKAADGSEKYMFPVVNFMGQAMYGQSGSGNSGPAPILWQWYGKDGDMQSPYTSFYINDKFSVNNHLNGMFGVRFENSKVNDTDGSQMANSTFISPRFQIKYDLLGDNAHVFGLTLARYGSDFQTGFATRFASKANSKLVKWGWTANQYDPYDSRDPNYGVRFVDIGVLTNPDNFKNPFYFENTSLAYTVDPKLSTECMDEFTLSYRRQMRQGSVSLTYVNRNWRNAWAFITEYAPEYVREVPDPSGSGMTSLYTTTIMVTNSDDLKRKYEALEAEFNARLNAFWTIGGNWTISRLTGNHQGGDQSASTFRDNETTAYYLNWSLLEARGVSRDAVSPYGPLFNDEPQRGRLWALLALPLGKGQVSFSWSLRYDSTRPGSLTYYGPLLTSSADAIPRPDGLTGVVPGRPSVYTQFYNRQRDMFRSNDFYRADFKVSFAIPLGLPGFGSRVQMIGDIYVNNLFNTSLIPSVYMGTSESNFASIGSTGKATFHPSNLALWGSNDFRLGSWYRNTRDMNFSFGLKF